LQRAVRARFVDDVGQVLRQEFERRVDGKAKMAREFLRLGVAENGLELIFGDWKIGARPKPLDVEPAFCRAASTALMAAGRAAVSTSPRAPLSTPPRLRPSNKPMVASSTG
jgi:hypothetical protein